jgi:hypothetical protein
LAKKCARQNSPPQSEKTAQELIKIIRESVGVLLFRNARALERVLLGRLATEGFSDLRRRHSVLAGHMRFEGIRTTALAEAAGMSKQAVGMLVTGPSRGSIQLLHKLKYPTGWFGINISFPAHFPFRNTNYP